MTTALMMVLLAAVAVVVGAAAVAAGRDESRGVRWRRGRSAGRGVPASAVAELFTDADRRYLADSWRRVAGLFPLDPAVAVDIAHKTAESVFRARGLDPSRLPAEPADLDRGSADELRLHLLRYERLVGELTGAVPFVRG